MNRREAIKRTALVSGFAVSGSLVSAILQGCGEEVSTASDWTPEFFTAEEAEQVAALAEAILPKTDTPGARDAQVERYIDMIAKNIFSEAEQARMKKGVAEMYNAYEKSGGKAFSNATAEEQLAYLQQVEMDARQIAADNGKLPPAKTAEERLERRPFFADFYQLVISGYFTSKLVGMEVLPYDPVPGEWIPCGDLQELTGGRNWAL
jgi:hypothetical protein